MNATLRAHNQLRQSYPQALERWSDHLLPSPTVCSGAVGNVVVLLGPWRWTHMYSGIAADMLLPSLPSFESYSS